MSLRGFTRVTLSLPPHVCEIPREQHIHAPLPRAPPLAHSASMLGETVVRRCLCCLDLNWPALNSTCFRGWPVVTSRKRWSPNIAQFQLLIEFVGRLCCSQGSGGGVGTIKQIVNIYLYICLTWIFMSSVYEASGVIAVSEYTDASEA